MSAAGKPWGRTQAEVMATNAVAEICVAVGIVALLHAGEMLTAADVKAAVGAIEDELALRDALLPDVVTPAPSPRDLPILTLAEVAARHGDRAATRLTLVTGGAA